MPGTRSSSASPTRPATVTGPRHQTQYTGPELTFWTQLSIIDARCSPFGAAVDPGDYAFSAARVYACIDHNDSGACDTKETGNLSGSEKWEPLRAWYSPETSYRINNFINCMYDPTDDGNTEIALLPEFRHDGPSSTCAPERRRHLRRPDPERRSRTGSSPSSSATACFPETGVEARTAEGIRRRHDLARRPLDPQALPPRRFRRPEGPLPLAHLARRTAAASRAAPRSSPGVGATCDDGWFIDDIRVNGLAQPLTLLVDNAGEAIAPPTPTICTNAEIDPAMAAIPYPTFDTNTNKSRPAAPARSTPAESMPATSTTTTPPTPRRTRPRATRLSGRSSSPASLTPGATCVGGELEYRFRDGFGAVLSDWSATAADQQRQPDRDSRRLHRLLPRRALLGQPGRLLRPTRSGSTSRRASAASARRRRSGCRTRTTVSWTGSGTFDTAKGDVAALRSSSGSFAGASCLENNGADTSTTDAANPAAGASFYYLVRCDGGTWDDPAGTGQVGLRGSTLTACP